MYQLSSLYDYAYESGDKRCCLFPFSISIEIGKNDLFNPGTAFKGLLSRMRDTVDNTLIDSTKFLRKDDTNPDNFKFPKNYIQILQNNFLKGERISLVHFSSWFFRFRGIQCPDEWVVNPTLDIFKGFTRVCTKTLVKELKLNEIDIETLFYHDETEIIKFGTSKIKGDTLRGMMNFNKDYTPEISVSSDHRNENDYMNDIDEIEISKTVEFAQPIGNNISPSNLYELLLSSKQVILYGSPGTGKSHITNKIRDNFATTKIIQFHASLTYEQFIGGISIDNKGSFVNKAGAFLEFCEEARKSENDNKKFLLIIDEINRGNVSKIFGETILTLDREYIADLVIPIEYEGRIIKKFSIPSNVYIIATMNSADRSIAKIDYAIRRRFAFVKFYPNYELVRSMSDCTKLPNIKPDVLLKSINSKIFNVLKDDNMLLGHAYFIPKWVIKKENKIEWSPEVLQILFNYYILPIIEEYTYGNSRFMSNILGETFAD